MLFEKLTSEIGFQFEKDPLHKMPLVAWGFMQNLSSISIF